MGVALAIHRFTGSNLSDWNEPGQKSIHYVTDIHATVLHVLGLDPLKPEVPGRKRLEMHHGTPIREILA